MAEAAPVTARASGLVPRLPLGDARLARMAAAGDERAFAAIFKRYHQELYRFCQAILGNPDDAQDALQATMASALRALPGESREVALRPWLYRVARNEALSLIRRRRESGLEAAELPPAPGADAQAETRATLRELVADLGALPERQRSALVMRELSGLRHEEIAAALAITPAAARQAVYEARNALLELSEGRRMRCDEVRKLVSDRDGRVLRGRRIRAHLRACQSCAAFRDAIGSRRADLAALAPPLPAAASAPLLAGLLGAEGAKLGAGGAAGWIGLGVGGISAKSVSVIAATAAVGLGAAGATGTLEVPGLGGAGGEREATPASAPASDVPHAVPAQGPSTRAGERPLARGEARSAGRGREPAGRPRHEPPASARSHAAPGRERSASQAAAPPAPPGRSADSHPGRGAASGGQAPPTNAAAPPKPRAPVATVPPAVPQPEPASGRAAGSQQLVPAQPRQDSVGGSALGRE